MEAIKNQQETEDLKTFLDRQGYVAIPITENIAGHLLIEVIVNETPGLFILDTGAGTTVVDSNKVDALHLHVEKDNTSFTGAGAGGLGLEVCPSEGNTITMGKFTLTDFMITVMSLEHVSQSLLQIGANEEVTGIIGVDILKPSKAIIDYSKMTLYLQCR